MLYALRNNDKFTRIDDHGAVAKLHVKLAGNDEKHLVFVFVEMPDECALKLRQLYSEIIDFADDFGAPLVAEKREFLCQIHFFCHCASP
jgi:hypothetical protein